MATILALHFESACYIGEEICDNQSADNSLHGVSSNALLEILEN